jgi:hypothetical protein
VIFYFWAFFVSRYIFESVHDSISAETQGAIGFNPGGMLAGSVNQAASKFSVRKRHAPGSATLCRALVLIRSND